MTEHFKTCRHILNGRNLVVCIDGTSNQFGETNTNVIELYNLILKEDSNKQRTWYNSGIGTYARSSKTSLEYYKKVMYQKIDLAIAWDFERTVLGAYRWLSDSYEDGDRIFLFGFSRGAYQVRVLSAMIDKVGLIHKGNKMQIPFAYELYADPSSDTLSTATAAGSQERGTTKAQRFKNTFSRTNVLVHFVGTWDTVSSIGLARGTRLPGTVDGMTHVCYFRHALALDEKRVKFLPEYAYGGRAEGETQNTNNDDSRIPKEKVVPDFLGKKDSSPRRPQTLEVWFAGTHSDIGGGNVQNEQLDRSRPPLRWMVFEAQAVGLYVAKFNRDLSHEELIEVRESLTWRWWPLEILPIRKLTFTTEKVKEDQFTWMPNLGSPRQILPGQKIHSSLLLSNTDYVPQAYPPEGVSSFWKRLRKDEDFRHKWVEFDLYEYTEDVISHFIVDPDKASHTLHSIAASNEGRQAVIVVLKRNHLPVHEEARCQILGILVDAVHQNPQSNSQFKRSPLSEIRHVVADLLKTKQHREMAKEFIVWFTDRCINTLQGHKAQVNCVAFSPNGKCIASASVDYTVRIWSVETWSQMHQLSGHLLMVSAVVFSFDGGHVVSGSWDRRLWIWNTETGKPVGELNGHEDVVTSLAVSPDGKQVVSGSCDRTVRIWDLATREQVNGPFRGQTDCIQSVSFSPGGNCVASGSNDNTTQIWDLRTGNQMGKPLRMHRDISKLWNHYAAIHSAA